MLAAILNLFIELNRENKYINLSSTLIIYIIYSYRYVGETHYKS
jgi:hypothetical protein